MSQHSRQTVDEQRWAKRFQSYLRREFALAAKEYLETPSDNPYAPNEDSLQRMLTQMHRNIILREAELTYIEHIMPYEEQDRRKDMLDLVASIFRGGGLISFWQNVLGQYLQARIAESIKQISDTTRKRIAQIIQKGVDEGMGVDKIAARIEREGASGLTRTRSRAIARTESISAMNQGSMLAARSSELEFQKKWNATIDQRTRLTHHDADIHGDWVDLDQDFFLDGPSGLEPADAPGDPRLSAANSVNCRCSVLLRPKRDINGRLIRKP